MMIDMRRIMPSAILALSALVALDAPAQAVGVDTGYRPRITRPAYSQAGPRVLIDEAHGNYHKIGGTYQAFADLIRADGYVVEANTKRFDASDMSLATVAIVVIPGARGDSSAFAPGERIALAEWVRNGGSLLLIGDHAPDAAPIRPVAASFSVDLRDARTLDAVHHDTTAPLPNPAARPPGWLVFSDGNGLLGRHVILRGRDESEAIHRVTTFVGTSLRGPAGSDPLLVMSSSAIDRAASGDTVRAEGRAQAVAFPFGRGKVVVLAEAAVLTSQVAVPGPPPLRIGLDFRGSDNEQLALNIMHWLSGVLR